MATRNLDSKAVASIMNKRSLVTLTLVGKRVALLVQGNGNIIDVEDAEGNLVPSAIDPEMPLQKKIFNLRANSQVAMQNPLNREILKAAIAAEKAGDVEEAHDRFNEYLNKVQFSAGILLPSTMADRVSHGCEVVGTIQLFVNEKDATKRLLRFEDGTISVQAPEIAGKTTFSLEDALGLADEKPADNRPEPTAVPANETAAQKKARIKKDLERGVKAERIVGHTVGA
jgi:hypothetical protein